MTQHTPPSPGDNTPGSNTAKTDPGAGFFRWIRSLDITRSDDSWVAGVCGGIANRIGIDPLIVRGLVIVVAIFGGPALLLYAAAWLLLPDSRGLIHLEQALRGIATSAIWAIGALLLVSLVPSFQGLWWQGPPGWWGMPDWLAILFRTMWSIIVVIATVWLAIFVVQKIGKNKEEWKSNEQRTENNQWTDNYPKDMPTNSATNPQGGYVWNGSAWVLSPEESNASDQWSQTHSGHTQPHLTQPNQAHPNQASSEQQRTSDERFSQNADFRSQRMDARAQRHQAREDYRREHKRKHLSAGFIAIALGLAVIVGASAATVASLFENSANVTAIIGIASALAIIGAAVIVAGVRGKTSDGLGFWVFLSIVGIFVTGFFPIGHTQFALVGTPSWSVTEASPSQQQGFAVIAGSPTLDLTELDRPSADIGGIVDVWLPAGSTTIVLPSSSPVIVETNTLIGAVNVDNSRNKPESSRDQNGVLINSRIPVKKGQLVSDSVSMPRDTTTVRVWSLIGNTTLTITTNGAKND